jgi:flagellar hook-associated protein 3 FlgL
MSTRITEGMRTATVLADISRASQRLTRTQEIMATGKLLTKPSDDPFEVSRALQYRSDIEQHRQYQINVREAQAWHDVTDTALSHMADYTQRARELLVRGANDTLGPTERAAIAAEMEQIVDALKGEANAQYGGRFIFAGTATKTQPYTPGAVDTFAGNSDAINREIGPGVSLQVNSIGQSLVGDATGGLIFSLRTIITNLNSGNTAALRSTDLNALDTAQDALANERSKVGARMQRLESADARLAELEETQTALLSETEDADMAKTMIDFSMQQAVYQSALKAGAQIIQTSLLDFLR